MKFRFSKRKRFACFAMGLALCGLGVAMSTRPELGTSPISSFPYVMTFIAPLTLGQWTIIINVLMVLAQIAILRKEFQWFQLSQMIASVLLGTFIDAGMWLTAFFIPQNYLLCMAEQLLGCAVLACGITMELIAEVTYMPGEGLVKTISEYWRLNFGKVKICFDLSLVVIALAVSLSFCGEINGIREGTLVAAFAVGLLVKSYLKPFRSLKRLLVKA